MYDIAIIGAGPAGISCAKAAISHGLKGVLLEENIASFGGVCLNNGCIPTKFLIHNSTANKSWNKLIAEKNQLIEKIKSSLLASLKKQGFDIVFGRALFVDNHTLSCGTKTIAAKHIVIASGSTAQGLFSAKGAVSPEALFNLTSLPEDILVIGGGYIGVELACLLSSFGRRVTLIEKEGQILPSFDNQLSRRLQLILTKKGIDINISVDAASYDFTNFGLVVEAVGRKPAIKGLKVENAGVKQDAKGWVMTDERLKTSQNNIYACGDVCGRKLLAYTAEYQGRLCVKNIKGANLKEEYDGLPECVFAQPQLAKVGVLEAEAESRGINFRVIKSNFLKFSSAYVYNDTDGFIKILVDDQDKIIGAGMISEIAGELISIFSLCIKNKLKIGDLKKCLFIHPTLSEILTLLLQ